jgi:hypothetical protein
LVIFILSCSKDDDPTSSDILTSSDLTSISGTIPNYNLGVDKVIRLTYWGNSSTEYPDFGSGTVDANGNFNIPSLNTVPANYLEDISDIPSGVTASDPSLNARGGCVLRVYTSSATIPTHTVDRGIFHSSNQVGDYYINIIYADRDCTVQGTQTESYKKCIWNIKLKKGWNKFAEIVKQVDPLIMEYTNEEPAGGYWYLY